MNELIARLMALDRPRRYGVYAGLFVVVIFLFWWFLYAPKAARIAETQTQVDTLEAQVARKRQMASRLATYQNEVKEMNARLNQAMAQLPDEKEIPDLLSNISTLGRDSGLDIVLFRQRPESYHEFYAEVPVEMMMRGTYRQVAAFLEKVGDLDRIVNVTNLAMKNPVVTDAEVMIDTSCTAVTFRFLSEEEREKLAAQEKKKKR